MCVCVWGGGVGRARGLKGGRGYSFEFLWSSQDPNTKRFKRTLIYFDTDTQNGNFQGNLLYQATKRHLNNR